MPIELLPFQTEHVERLEDILINKDSFFAMDLSNMGNGKTYTSSFIGKKYFKHMIVVGPKSVLPKWEDLGQKESIPIRSLLTFAALRGINGKQSKHGLLLRNDVVSREFSARERKWITITSIEYTPTDLLKKYVKEGLLLVIDEFQNIKNKTSQQLSCQALIQCIRNHVTTTDNVVNEVNEVNEANEANEVIEISSESDSSDSSDESDSENSSDSIDSIDSNSEGSANTNTNLVEKVKAAKSSLLNSQSDSEESSTDSNSSDSDSNSDSDSDNTRENNSENSDSGEEETDTESESSDISESGTDKQINNLVTGVQAVNLSEATPAILPALPRRSKVILLSGSPVDKMQQIGTLFQTTGILTEERLAAYNMYARALNWEEKGMGEIVRYCLALDTPTTRLICKDLFDPAKAISLRTDSTLIPIIYQLFQKVVKPHLSSYSVVDLQANANVVLERRNAFYDIQQESDRQTLRDAVANLEKSVSYDKRTETVNYRAAGASIFSKITSYMMDIEKAKIHTMFRIVQRRMQSHPHEKIVVCLNYISNLQTLQTLLERHTQTYPLRITGATSSKARKTILNRFASSTQSSFDKVLIGNLAVLAVGIDLDDKVGDRNRFCLVSPNFRCLDLYQLCFRFLRQDTKSSSVVHMMYASENDCKETNVLNALARKGGILKDTTGNQEINMVYPNEYENWYENPNLIPI